MDRYFPGIRENFRLASMFSHAHNQLSFPLKTRCGNDRSRSLFEITQTRHPGVLAAQILRGQALAWVQQFKELDSGQNLSRQVSGREACRNDEGGISCTVVTLWVMGVSYHK
jgi:hypothetical protein